ncbi:MAG TPA: hypothetical protein P5123_09540, partial [Spirochaetota bacterium]|nr:hypothetical protein [Spirochaetota bacterium]
MAYRELDCYQYIEDQAAKLAIRNLIAINLQFKEITMYKKFLQTVLISLVTVTLLLSCSKEKSTEKDNGQLLLKPGEPLVTDNFTADPSAHVFEGKLYIYPSHDIDTGVADSTDGSHYDMKDYHVYSITDFNSPITDHGTVLKLEDIPWASKQLW